MTELSPSERAAIEAAEREAAALTDPEAPTIRTGSGELAAFRESAPLIVAHKLTYAKYVEDRPGPSISPEIIVLHYTATQQKSGVIAAFKADDFLSCHLTIDQDGSVTQMVPFNRKAYHAGESEWKGRKACNAFSIGVEIVNPGPLFKVGDGKFTDIYHRPWFGAVVQRKHKNGKCPYEWWAQYPDEQIEATIRVCAELVSYYSLTHVVGHDDVAPTRKIDPGPAFPWEPLLTAVYPREYMRT